MKSHVSRKLIVLFALLLIAAPAALIAAERHHDGHAGSGAASQAGNPLIDEMLKLDAAFREIVSAVAVSDGARVHQALESLHGAMEKTHEGVHQGMVKIPKNADRVKEFVAMDKAFHAKLETLAEAARKNNERAMVKLTKELLDGCVRCHRQFRNP